MEVLKPADVFRQNLTNPGDHIVVAYDDMTWEKIRSTSREVGPYTLMGKTNSVHVRPGADFAVETLAQLGQETWLDYKFHDIPQTVELSVQEATEAGGSLITVHASGGFKMLKAAVAGAAKARNNLDEQIRAGLIEKKDLSRIGHVLGITVLTSLQDETYSIFGLDPEDEKAIVKKVLEFVKMAKDAGLTGIVCSPLEARAVREDPDNDGLLVVTPAITPIFANQAADQKRSTNAIEAMRNGADMVAIGRGINLAAEYGLTKSEAAIKVGEEVGEGLELRRTA